MSAFNPANCYLGFDIGSVSLSYVLIDQNQRILQSDYLFHHGNILNLLKEKLAEIDLSRVDQVAYNHKSSDFFISGVGVNEQVAVIEGVRYQVNPVGSVFTIGGETFGLILFDEKNQYQKYISNSSCAAGTGAFLDQQAERLGLSGSAELSQLADSFSGEPPKIATRCAVFAKTDLIHCQQQGYSIQAISAGLCQGLAHNIVDTLMKGVALRQPVVVVGGVSKNPQVMRYLAQLVGCPLTIPADSELTGAIGCALIAHSRPPQLAQFRQFSPQTLLKPQTQAKHYFFGPLTPTLSQFPDFFDHTHYILHDVEVDLYHLPSKKGIIPVYLGIDIGSTSTKAMVTEAEKGAQILLGLYTRTMGQPIKATQRLLRVLKEIEEAYEIHFEFCGVGVTGSGRKFIQKVINADLAIDEITAHAKAAYALNPNVDTIIEIGGQDSKFTVMKNGQVTFSVMNYVCAAGTGSFIEEQAKRLNVPLSDYANRATGAPSPLTSDRCTVFMERDLNHYLSQGYSKEELLAATLHSIRDNYLSKVAHLNKIGEVICFQGATAKNKALVAAFEQKLQKPIMVSKYCHLTGAMGICLLLSEKGLAKTHFRGLNFYQESPIVSEEVCDLCKNHCKLKKLLIANESIMWGFMCGRDQASNAPNFANPSGFDLLSSRRRVFSSADIKATPATFAAETLESHLEELRPLDLDRSLEKLKEQVGLNLLKLRHKFFAIGQEEIQAVKEINQITIGLPDALYMVEFLPFWKLFFKKLGYRVYVSPANPELLAKGKEVAGADFCASIAYWHGHVVALCDRSDYLFLPHMLEAGEIGEGKFYCYYSNYAVALLQNVKTLNLEHRSISPYIDFSKPAIHNIQQIYESLPQELKLVQTPGEIREAYLQTWAWFMARKKQLIEIFQQQINLSKDVEVVLLGRPYLVMDPVMNKNIPQRFNQLGLKTFFQDMLPPAEIGWDSPTREFMAWNHWKYGANILQTLDYIGSTPGLYPVYLSAFKCSPDSFVLNYFKEIMDAYQKPYLILQIDEHGSDVGYSTRVEAAVETFRHHFQQNLSVALIPPQPRVSRPPIKQQTILVPNFDPLSSRLVCAAFEHGGYPAYLIEETPTTVVSSLRLNDGQCLPVSSVVQGAIETVQKYHLNPADAAIFMNTITPLACNFPQYPLMAKKLLQQTGQEFEEIQVMATEFDMRGLPLKVIYDIYCGHLLGGLIRRMGCKLRPYELIPGQTNWLINEAQQRLYHCIAAGDSKETVFQEIVADFAQISITAGKGTRPKVAIIGDVYVRDNDVFNQELISDLESYGAEVVTTPLNYVLRLSAAKESQHFWQDGRYMLLLGNKLMVEVLEKFEKHFYQIARPILAEDFPTFEASIFDCLKKYNLSFNHGGETAQNIVKIFSLLKHYPDISLFIHVYPIFCCPGLVSESLFKAVEQDIGLPIVSVVYDGTTAKKNESLAPYLHYLLHSCPTGHSVDEVGLRTSQG